MAVQVLAAPVSRLNQDEVLLKAVRRAGEELGLSTRKIDQAIGCSNARSYPSYAGRRKSNVTQKVQRQIASVLRLHRSLSALVEHDVTLMRHWMAAANRHTGGVPRRQLQDPGKLLKMSSIWKPCAAAVSRTAFVDVTALTGLEGVVMRLVKGLPWLGGQLA
ncbi:MAG: hypothetical protein OXE74_02370 [Cyanobacteria bacterium MAG CAR2_bin_4]|nr:hypothetical protein [Cyanobacteria bacterium MAG CAR2_bin_4]